MALLNRRGTDLTVRPVGDTIVGALRHFDGERYLLFDYTVMPDHLHFIFKPLPGFPLSKLHHSLKSWTAHEINKRLGRTGELWENGTHREIIRSRREHEDRARYIFLNPVARGLTRKPEEWPYWGRGSGVP
ncbi:transposase [bacterium]|nr:transposase [bacterium]